MIMDLMAALALAAERPNPSVIFNPPVSVSDPIITKTMWRQILGMTAYISFVMVFMFFFLDQIWDLPIVHASDSWYTAEGAPTGKTIYFTLLFNIFVYLNLFNEINARKVKGDQYNVFSHILENFYFLGVFAITVGVQYAMTQYGGRMTRCSPLTSEQHAFCILVGATALLAGFFLKLVPDRYTEKVPVLIDEKKSSEHNFFVKLFRSQADAKMSDIKLKKAASGASPAKSPKKTAAK
jgi:Ca2+ transporting ATPase